MYANIDTYVHAVWDCVWDSSNSTACQPKNNECLGSQKTYQRTPTVTQVTEVTTWKRPEGPAAAERKTRVCYYNGTYEGMKTTAM